MTHQEKIDWNVWLSPVHGFTPGSECLAWSDRIEDAKEMRVTPFILEALYERLEQAREVGD